MYDFLLKILPSESRALFERLPWERVYELRLRANCPVVVSVSGKRFYLTENGLSNKSDGAVVVTRTDLDSIVHKASDYSVYSVNDQLKQGFLTIRGGVRIGICGELVSERGVVSTIKNINSLNIRIPHEVRECSSCVVPYVFGERRPHKTLIIAPPGAGKTTFLRDLANQVDRHYVLLNTLIIDERGELAACHLGENQLDVGDCADVLTGSDKAYGFDNGIRSMGPDVVITDEIATEADIDMIARCCRSGVAVLASVHAGNLDEVRMKPFFKELISAQVFDRYVVLGIQDRAGVVLGVYDKNLKLMAQ
jgi:stage III sporulation protein AA